MQIGLLFFVFGCFISTTLFVWVILAAFLDFVIVYFWREIWIVSRRSAHFKLSTVFHVEFNRILDSSFLLFRLYLWSFYFELILTFLLEIQKLTFDNVFDGNWIFQVPSRAHEHLQKHGTIILLNKTINGPVFRYALDQRVIRIYFLRNILLNKRSQLTGKVVMVELVWVEEQVHFQLIQKLIFLFFFFFYFVFVLLFHIFDFF